MWIHHTFLKCSNSNGRRVGVGFHRDSIFQKRGIGEKGRVPHPLQFIPILFASNIFLKITYKKLNYHRVGLPNFLGACKKIKPPQLWNQCYVPVFFWVESLQVYILICLVTYWSQLQNHNHIGQFMASC